jgi:hypothetical protein
LIIVLSGKLQGIWRYRNERDIMHVNIGRSRLAAKLGATAVVAGAAVLPMLAATPASATVYTGDLAVSQTVIPTMAPGGTGNITIRMTSVSGTNGLNGTCNSVTVTVPNGFTLTGTPTVSNTQNTPSVNLFPSNGTRVGTVSNNNTTWTYPGQCMPFNAGGYIEFTLPVQASASLATGQYTAGGTMSITGVKMAGASDTFTDTNAANNTSIPVQADVVAPVPMADGRVAAAAGLVVLLGGIPIIRRRRAKARMSAEVLQTAKVAGAPLIMVESAWARPSVRFPVGSRTRL